MSHRSNVCRRISWISPASQIELEEVLLDALATGATALSFDTELVSLDSDDGGVTAVVRDPEGVERPIRATYVLGADGTHLAGIGRRCRHVPARTDLSDR
jgi:hypothetical protein